MRGGGFGSITEAQSSEVEVEVEVEVESWNGPVSW